AAATVLVSDDLVSFVEADAFDDAEVRAALRASLPDYMIPQALVPLAQLPRSANDKIDFKALEALARERAAPPGA
ncbi:MAG: hypothetical protein AAFR16_12200, partial [Pseudomonadota bacterium]